MKNILIIEDDPILSELYKMVFTKEGYQVSTAGDGVAGLEQIAAVKPSIVLLDIMMPRMNGLELLEHLRSEEATKNLPVIVTTNLMDASLESKARKFGISQFLIKSQYLPKDFVDFADKILEGQA